MRKEIITGALLAGFTATGTAVAANGDTTFGAQTFFDFSHIEQLSNGVDVAPTGTGFDVKRLYLIVDHTFNDTFSANLTTDAQYSSSTTAGSGGVTEVFIKKLYLQAKVNDELVLHAGSYNMPWIPYVESFYGYRFVEKTTLDRLGFGNTTDWGVNAGGRAGGGLLDYSASVVNGSGFKNPTRTKDVDFEGRVGVSPLPGLTLAGGVYSGHLGQITTANENFQSNTAQRLDGLANYTIAGFHVGLEYWDAKNYKTVATAAGGVFGTSAVVATSATAAVPNDEASGVSSWVSYDFSKQYSIFGRFDDSKLSKTVDPKLQDQYFNLGVDYRPIPKIDVAAVYKDERVSHGSTSVSGFDANGSNVIGGTSYANGGLYKEFGLFAQWTF